MKRAVLLVLLALALPVTAFAGSSIDFTNTNGTLSGSSAGLTLSGSSITQITGWNGQTYSGNLGTYSLSIGALTSGTLSMGGTFSGGSITLVGNGTDGLPNGTIFSGTFTGPVTLTLQTLANGTHQYTLSGFFNGTLNGPNGSVNASGNTYITLNTGSGYFNGNWKIQGGYTTINTGIVPEPATLGLFGSGLVGLAILFRHRAKKHSS